MTPVEQSPAKLWLIGAAGASVFFIYNLWLISNGHFHEDAYILFIYVDNILSGNGISYYPGGPHAEGATDFLWLLLLTGVGLSGLDVGTSTILLNSVGAGIITTVISHEIMRAQLMDKKTIGLMSLFVVLWAVQSPLVAAVSGFSVYLYMALVLLTFVATSREEHLSKVPYLAIIIALFRPDGVIMGVAFTLIGLVRVYKRRQFKTYLLGMLIAFVIGIVYFVWRYHYFGNLLPLPLYVKGHTDLTESVRTNLRWGVFNLYTFLPCALLLLMSKKITHYLVLMSPLILLFVALTMVHQSQNIGYRFQAPIFIVAYFVLVQLLLARFKEQKAGAVLSKGLVVYLVGFVVIAGYHVNKSMEMTTSDHRDLVPYTMHDKLPKDLTIAVTKAGRFSYWNQSGGHVLVDLVGLNSVYPAKNIIDMQYMKQLSPDVLLFHQNLIDPTPLVVPGEKVLRLTDNNKQHFKLKSPPIDAQRPGLSKVSLAATVSIEFLQSQYDDYDIYLIYRPEDKFRSHIYAFKKSLGISSSMAQLLKDSFEPKNHLSYYQMISST